MTSAQSPGKRQWLKITLFCPLPLLEPAADLMGVLSDAGVEQSPETETGAYLSGFFPLAADDNSAPTADELLSRVLDEMTRLFALYERIPDRPTVTVLADEDWATSWQQYFKPFAIVPGLVIKPSWETYRPTPGERVIEMDPGMAFGTGQHASTRMALALIKESMTGGHHRQALDVGTGTGILAMAAALFGAQRVVAIDNDPDAVAVAAENVANNGLAGTIEVSVTPLNEIRERFSLVCANIVHDVLVEMAASLAGLTASGGHLVLAGILHGDQEENIVRVYQRLGLQPLASLQQEEWAALLLQRP